MSNLHTPTARKSIESRLQELTHLSTPKWGRMNASQMLCHCADQLRFALETRQGKDVSTIFRRSIAKNYVLHVGGFPKTGVKTLAEMDPEAQGTPSAGFETDRDLLLETIRDFCLHDKREPYGRHPYFGGLNYIEWGRLAWLHLNHHLSQFGK